MSEDSSSTLKRAFVDFSKDFAWAPADWIILGMLAICRCRQLAEGQRPHAAALARQHGSRRADEGGEPKCP